MAKTQVISLKGIVREISRTQAQLEKAKKTATSTGKERLSVKIRNLQTIKKAVILNCKGGFNITVPVA